MQPIIRGRSWVFSSNVSTDEILPGRYLERSNEEVGRFVMAGLDPSFASQVSCGDFIVAGANFGCGSSRETAAVAIKNCGVAAVVAVSFARIFFRNAINIGLPAVVVGDSSFVRANDMLEIDFENRTVANLSSGDVRSITNLRGISWQILSAGGIVAFTKERLAERGSRAGNID